MNLLIVSLVLFDPLSHISFAFKLYAYLYNALLITYRQFHLNLL